MSEKWDGHAPSGTETTTSTSDLPSESTYETTFQTMSESPSEPQAEPLGESTSGTVTAKEEAGNVAKTASQSGQQVAATAVEQGRRVAGEAAQQVRSVLDDARQQVSQQAGGQQHKAAETLRSLGDELATMADSSDDSGLGKQLVRQASDQVLQVAGWLENRDPQGVLHEVRGFAQRRPGTFLLAAGAAGLLAGRLTRGAVDERRSGSDDTDSGSAQSLRAGAPAPAVPPAGAPSGVAEGVQRL